MKAFRFTLFLGVFAMLLAPNTIGAATRISVEETREVVVKKMLDNKADFSFSEKMEKKASKLAIKFKKRIAKVERFLGKVTNGGIDFKDPIKKWLWFGLLGWLAGAVIYSFGFFIAAPFWYLGYLCWLGGSICIVIWLLKRSGNM